MAVRPGKANGAYTGNDGTGTPGPPGPPGSGSWVKTSIAYTHFSVAAMQGSFAFYSLPGTYDIQHVVLVPTIAFTGPGITSVNASAGISGNVEQIAPKFPVTTVANNNLDYVNVGIMYDMVAATNITVTLFSTGANLNALTAGNVDIYLFITNLNNV